VGIARDVIRALKENDNARVYGFANGRDIAAEPDLIDVLREWLRVGYPVGNHSYSHIDLNSVNAKAYIADIEKMDGLLQTLSPVSPLILQRRVYRYPYLDEGDTLEKRNAVRDYLFIHGYRIAEVSIDYYDWAWNAAYSRCIAQHDDKSIAWLKAKIVDAAERSLYASRAVAEEEFGRDISHILLVHVGAFDAMMLGTILKDFRARGVRFISLDDALADPVYKMNPNFAYKIGLTFPEQIAAARGLNIEKLEDTPYTLERLKGVCNEPQPKK